MKKIYILIGSILLLFTFYLIIIYVPKNYKLIYQKNDFEVEETYNRIEKKYFFNVSYENVNYPLVINKKYSRKRKLISNITINKLGDEKCLNIYISDKLYNICSEKNELKSINTMSSKFNENYGIHNKSNEKKYSFNKIDIYNDEKNYLVWNYKGFYRILKNNDEVLNIFSKDNYKNLLSFQTNEYLIFPNYDSNYYFKKMYIYDTKNNILNDINFDDEISYDTYYLGVIKNKLYLVDKKNQVEYEIDLNKNTIRPISKGGVAYIYNGEKLEETFIKKLIINEQKFVNKDNYEYFIDNNTLYLRLMDKSIKVSNLNVKKIVYINKDVVYYLSGDKLYMYQYNSDEQLLLGYTEWNFNYNNHIFIFD